MSLLLRDPALWAAFRRGEDAALGAVYREYEPPLSAMLLRGFTLELGAKASFVKGLSDRRAREDASQEVFLRAFTSRSRLAYDGVTPYRTYLFSIARNLLIDSARAVRRHAAGLAKFKGLVSEHPDATQPFNNPEHYASNRQFARFYQRFVADLNLRERALFEARFESELSHREVALRLGVSEHQAKQGEKMLRKRFFEAMRGNGFFDGLRYGRDGVEKASADETKGGSMQPDGRPLADEHAAHSDGERVN